MCYRTKIEYSNFLIGNSFQFRRRKTGDPQLFTTYELELDWKLAESYRKRQEENISKKNQYRLKNPNDDTLLNKENWFSRRINTKMVLSTAAGAAIGFFYAGIPGATIGALVGATASKIHTYVTVKNKQ